MSSIDIEEILTYEPPEKRKRVRLEQNGREEKKTAPEATATATASDDQLKQLQAALESAEETEPLDETGVKKLILGFEKSVLKNQEMRIKFPHQPPKFMESEVDLNQTIQEMHAVATMPSLYGLLTELDAVQSLMQLLAHDNADIVVAVIDLLQELTDLDTLEESEEGAKSLIDTLSQGQIVALLVQAMDKLNESVKDEADGVHNGLAVVENLIEFNRDICGVAVAHGLLHFLLRRVRQKAPFDGNKLYSSEILAILVQESEDVRKALGEKDGIDILLQALATYKRHDPTSADERELMENLFDTLCASLMCVPNRAKFLEGEGLQLMNLMLRERKESRSSALKVLNYSTTGPEGADNCNTFVDILGLRSLFPLFMRTPSKNRRKGHTAEEHEEHVCAILASLLRSCTLANRERIVAKFVEQDHVKIDRLIELHFKYMERVAKFEKKASADDQEDADERYLARCDAGLFTLQLVDLVIADVCVSGAPTIKERATKLLSMKTSDFKSVTKTLEEYLANLGDDAELERNRVRALLDTLL